MSAKYKLLQVENGAEFELPEGWELVQVATSDSFRTWLLLRTEES